MEVLKRKYLKACSDGDINTVECMIKNKPFRNNQWITRCLNASCEAGHVDIVNLLVLYVTIINEMTVYYACKGGNLEIINTIVYSKKINIVVLIRSPNKIIWHYCLLGACEGGQLEVVKMFTNKVPRSSGYWTECFTNACKSGNIDVINYVSEFLAKDLGFGLLNWDDGKDGACLGGNLEIVKHVISRGNFIIKTRWDWNWNYGLQCACEGGNMEIVKFMLSKGATYYENGLRGACRGGHLDIICYMLDKGCNVDNLSSYLIEACEMGQLEVAKFIIKNTECGNLINSCMIYACYYGYTDFVKFLIDHGANYFNTGLIIASNMIQEREHHDELSIIFLTYFIRNSKENFTRNYIDDEHVDIIELLINEGANKYKYLKNTNNFRLYRIYCLYYGIDPGTDSKYIKLLQEHPPYVLFVNKTYGNINYCISKLPVELFRLLNTYL